MNLCPNNAQGPLCLFDGSPFPPDGNVLWDFAAAEKFALFGTSAKYLDALRKGGAAPMKTHDLTALRLAEGLTLTPIWNRRSGQMHLFDDPTCGGFRPKRRKPFFNGGCLGP